MDFLLPSVFQVNGWKSIWQNSARLLSWHKVEGLEPAFVPSFILTEIWLGIKDDFYDTIGNQHKYISNIILTKIFISFILKRKETVI